MFQHILVPLDGSARAEQVLSVAVRLARISEGTITLLNVVDIAHEAVVYGVGGAFLSPQTIEGDLTDARHYLEQVAQRQDLAGVSIEKRTVVGNPAESILSCVEELPFDLIVMSSHGYTGFKRRLLGSVAEKVARHAPIPVLILRNGEPLYTCQCPDGTNIVRALIPLDTSPRSQDAIPPAAALVAALSAPGHGALHLAQIVVMPEGIGKKEQEDLRSAARENLDAIGQSIRDGLVANVGPELHLELSWAISLDNDIAEGIVRIAENGEVSEDAGKVERCGLIALTTHGITGISKWAMGSITERVLRATALPLLIVRPADMIARERQQKERQAKITI